MGSNNISTIYYEGTQEQWNKLSNGGFGFNEELNRAKVYFQNTPPIAPPVAFDPTFYRAQFLLRTDLVNGMGILAKRTPAEEMVAKLKASGYADAQKGIQGFQDIADVLADMSNVFDMVAEPKDLYMGIILDALDSSVSVDFFNASTKDFLDDSESFTSDIIDGMKDAGCTIIDGENFKIKDLSAEDKEELDNEIKEWFSEKYPDLFTANDILSKITKVTEAVGHVEDMFERIITTVTLYNISDYMKAVVNQVAQDSHTSGKANKHLQKALDECLEIINASTEEMVNQVIEGEIVAIGGEVGKFIVGQLWEKITDAITLAFPVVGLIYGAYKVGVFLADKITGMNSSYEQYLKMMATTEVEDLVTDTYSKLEDNFEARQDIRSAGIYLSSLDLMFKLKDNDTIEAYEFIDILDNTFMGIIAKLFGRTDYLQTKIYLSSRQREYYQFYEDGVISAWIPQLKIDYPDQGIYELYEPFIQESRERRLKKEYVVQTAAEKKNNKYATRDVVLPNINITVLDSNNKVVAFIEDGAVSCSDKDITIAKANGQMTIQFYGNKDYTVEYQSTADEAIDLTINEYGISKKYDENIEERKEEEVIRTVNYDTIELAQGESISLDLDNQILQKDGYELISNGQAVEHDYDSLQIKGKAHFLEVKDGTLIQNSHSFIKTEAKENERFTLRTLVPDGKTFLRWEASNGETDLFADPTSPETTFTMPNEAVVITAVFEGFELPEEKPVTNLTLDQTELNFKDIDQTETLVATLTPSDATNRQIRWLSTNEAVATVDENGLVTLIGEGVATIIATTVDGGYTAFCNVTVEKPQTEEPPVEEDKVFTITLNTLNGSENPYTMVTDKEGKLTNLPVPSREGYLFKGWFTEVEGGHQITTSTVFKEDTSLYAQWIEEKEDVKVQSITLDRTDLMLNKLDITQALKATILPDDAANQEVKWTSTNEAVATVDEIGNVTSKGEGSAVIIATTVDGGFAAFCNVVVKVEQTEQPPIEEPSKVYTITLKANNETEDSLTLVTDHEGKLTCLPTPSREGYLFKGWFTEKEGGDQITVDTVFNTDTIVYAQWTAIQDDKPSVTPPVEDDKPSVTPPVEDDKPSVTPPVEDDKPSVTPPVEDDKPSVTPPVEDDKPSVIPPVEDDKPSVTPPVEDDKPSVTPPVEDDKPSVTPPVEDDKPSVTPPVEDDKPSVTPPVEDDKPSVTPPVEDDKPSVTPPVEDNKPSSSSTSSSHPSSSRYDIHIENVTNGQVSSNTNHTKAGETVMLTIKPNNGYRLEKLEVKDKDLKEITLTKKDNVTYSFIMPKSSVSITAQFELIEDVPAIATSITMPFTDVPENAWYHNAVQYVYSKGLMKGDKKETLFNPTGKMTRAMIVTVLYRLENEPKTGTINFKDVTEDKWYHHAIAWATEKQIVNGYSMTQFAPNDPITREQLATILYRYAQFKEKDVTTTQSLESYTDAHKVSDYAKEALSWANENELIGGMTDTTLNPKDYATRAQVAAILNRFITKL